jgi:hypothetical protein
MYQSASIENLGIEEYAFLFRGELEYSNEYVEKFFEDFLI